MRPLRPGPPHRRLLRRSPIPPRSPMDSRKAPRGVEPSLGQIAKIDGGRPTAADAAVPLSTRTSWAECFSRRCSVLKGKPVPISARSVPSTRDTSMDASFFQAPSPRAAHQRSPVGAHETAPTTGIPSIANATEEACIGWPCRKFVVPSSGSMIQTGPEGGVASGSPSWFSSATIVWSGWLSWMTATQASCAARSVADT